jgi:predicted enzyme related to lactoylglutathione lyase
MSKFHGTFIWHDLMASHCETSAAFYRQVMGWDVRFII